jgi:hypothetical protein
MRAFDSGAPVGQGTFPLSTPLIERIDRYADRSFSKLALGFFLHDTLTELRAILLDDALK